MSEPRAQHPFHLYDAIHQQPAIVRRMLTHRAEQVVEAARAATKKERLWIAGIGSSLYTAQIAEHFFRHLTSGRASVRAEQSFEFVRYPHALGPDDAVIVLSHTGGTTYSIEALQLARRSGVLTITISGENENAAMRSADFLINTCEQEVCFAYTKSLTAALARLALFAVHFAEVRGEKISAAKESLSQVPDLMQQALALEPQVKALASKIATRGRTVLFGAGPNWPTAREIALKIKESSFEPAEGAETEQLLHGPFSEVDEHMTLVAILSGAPADARARQILRAAGDLGAHRVAIHVPSAAPDDSAPDNLTNDWLAIPAVEEWLSPFVFLIPLQLLTYFLALARGTNPDFGHQDQPAHARARQQHYKY
ncbi:MAG TPA: SIS domain-containing protein [Candidatus Acidoferrales bacterium]|nr:SIS domain-containing protein [Candidatus Acidoferrales bacterium]